MSSQTDVAALTAGVVAVAVSIFVTDGPYDVVEAMVSITLLAVMYGYIWNQSRTTKAQSTAFGLVCGILVTPIVAYASEIYQRSLLAAPDPKASYADPCLIIAAWLVVAGLVGFADRRAQRCRTIKGP